MNTNTQSIGGKDKSLILGKATKRGIKNCPSCGTINGTRGTKCKNKKCNVALRVDENTANRTSTTASISSSTKQLIHMYYGYCDPQKSADESSVLPSPISPSSSSASSFTSTLTSTNSLEAVKIITHSQLDLYSVRISNRGIDYRSFVQLTQANEVKYQCYIDNCILKQQQLNNSSCTNSSPSSTQSPLQPLCTHIISSLNFKREAKPLQIKSSSLCYLNISGEIKNEIFNLVENSNTAAPLAQRINKETFVVKCIDEEKYPFGFLHVYFHDIRDNKNRQNSESGASETEARTVEKFIKRFSCTCSFYKKIVRLRICDLPMTKRHCIHFYSILATFLSDYDLCKEFETVLFNTETNEKLLIAKLPVRRLKPKSKVNQEVSQTNEDEDMTAIESNQPQKSSFLFNEKSASCNNQIANEVCMLDTSFSSNSNFDETTTSLQFIDWLTNVTEQINESMYLQQSNTVNSVFLKYTIPSVFFDCFAQRFALNNTDNSIVFHGPNHSEEISRTHTPPFGRFVKYTWIILSTQYLKAIFDTPNCSLETERVFRSNSDASYELLNVAQHYQDTDNLLTQKLYKTQLKIGKMNNFHGLNEPQSPFIIEWTPNLYQKTQHGELCLQFKYTCDQITS